MTTARVLTFHLFRGDVLLGTLAQTVPLEKLAWQGGVFAPTAEFERVRPLFDNELHLLRTSRLAEWRDMWNEIQRPGLRLEPLSGGEVATKFLIHIENETAWWR